MPLPSDFGKDGGKPMSWHSGKDTVENALNLDVLYFQRNKLFSWKPGFTYHLDWSRREVIIDSLSYAPLGPCGSPTGVR